MAYMFLVRVSAHLLLLLRYLLTIVCIPWMSRRSLTPGHSSLDVLL